MVWMPSTICLIEGGWTFRKLWWQPDLDSSTMSAEILWGKFSKIIKNSKGKEMLDWNRMVRHRSISLYLFQNPCTALIQLSKITTSSRCSKTTWTLRTPITSLVRWCRVLPSHTSLRCNQLFRHSLFMVACLSLITMTLYFHRVRCSYLGNHPNCSN